ncbi:MAG: sensor histidine kinase [Anaerolineae bacterium]|nr:sensor histidine kinase [Anaerolineae bacterium]
MKRQHLEPGLLPIFRAYVVVRTAALLLTGFVTLGWAGVTIEKEILLTAGLYVLEATFLFGYLYWPWGQRKLGRWYFPIAVFVAAVSPIVQVRYILSAYAMNAYHTIENLDLWLIFPFLTVPLILTAWQYSFGEVIWYCVGAAALELGILQFLRWTRAVNVWFDAGNLVARTVVLMAIGYIVSFLAGEQRRQRQELAAANRKLVRYAATQEQLAISRERNRLARELHDTLAHTLSGLTVQLDALSSVWQPRRPKARRMLTNALDTARTGLDETRRALQDLRAAPLDDLGLAMAVQHLAQNAAERGGLELQLDISEGLEDLPSLVEQTYYRVAQEALENVVKHSDAKTVTLALHQRGERLVLAVADDGGGFTSGEVDSKEQLGLQGMRERAALIGGTLSVAAQSDSGTTIRLETAVDQLPQPPEQRG